MQRQMIFLLIMLLGNLNGHSQSDYPVPQTTANHLFYIQRSGNTNTIMYDAVLNGTKKFNTDNPIHSYWIRFADKGEKKELSFIQRKFAYGVDARPSKNRNEFEFNIVSYEKRKMRLLFNKSGNPVAITQINGKNAVLKKVFIKMDPGTMLSFTPDIKYVELYGNDPDTGAQIYEKLIL